MAGSVALVLNSRPCSRRVAAAAATKPEHDAGHRQAQALADHLPEHLARARAEREADADLRHALRDHEADQAVDADGGEQQGEAGEPGDQVRAKPRLAGRVLDDLLDRMDVADRQVRIELRDDRP